MILVWLQSLLWGEDVSAIQTNFNKLQDMLLEQERELEEQRAKLRTLSLDLAEQQSINKQLEKTNLVLQKQLKEQEQDMTLLQHKLEQQIEQSEQVVLDSKTFYDKMMLSHKEVVHKLKLVRIKKKDADLKISELQSECSALLYDKQNAEKIIHEYEDCFEKYTKQMQVDEEEKRQLVQDIEDERKQRKEAEIKTSSCLKIIETLKVEHRNLDLTIKKFKQNDLDLLHANNVELQDQLESKQLENEELKRNIELKEEKFNDIMRDLDTLKEELNQNQFHKELLTSQLQDSQFIATNLNKDDISSRGDDSEREFYRTVDSIQAAVKQDRLNFKQTC